MYRILSCLGGEHDLRLVVLAGLICFLASVTAINLLHRAWATSGRARTFWVGLAGAATGCGIWATHFIAMLAYDPGVAIAYDVGLTSLSLVAAIAVTAAGLGLAVSRPRRAMLGGGIVGAGVACMHYTGMWALQLPGHVHWAPDLVAFSIMLGILFGMAALAVATRRADLHGTALAGLLLALAIVSHHFTAMGAVEIIPDPTRAFTVFSMSPTALAVGVAGVAVAVLGMTLVGAIADRRLSERDRQLDTAVNNMPHGIVMFDDNERLVLCNQRYLEMYDLSADVLQPGCTLRDVIRHRIASGHLDRDPEQYRSELLNAVAQGKTVAWVFDTKDGRSISVINRPFAGGYWIGTHEDVTERRRAERELERTKSFLDTVIENVPSIIVVKDAQDLRYVLVNRAGERYFGMPREQMVGKTAHDVFPPAAAQFIVESDRRLLEVGGEDFAEQHPIETPGNGTRIVTTRRLSIVGEDGKPQYLLGVVEDVTERKQAEERIAHMAHHDALTDLPNRAAFTQHLQASIERAGKASDTFAIVCIDLDRFKEINDVFGHPAGDALLREVARRLQDAAAGAFLARLGGDEYTLITAGDPSAVAATADRLLASTAEDFTIDGHRLRIGASIGVALFPSDGADDTTLLGNANAALYRAKADGRGTIRFFHAAMDQRLREQRALQHELRSALDNDELVLHYQPQASVTGEVTGFEALIRWHHPTRGLVPPGIFIPLAEESGSIVEIGEWTLRQACREAASWPKPLKVGINLSPVQFRHGDLPGLVHSVLLETGLPPHRLELEITEGVLIGDYSRAIAILRRLKSLGVRIAMDDFGTGYSSLSYLHAFPFDKIKIDRAFISNLDRNVQSAAIIRAVIGLARGLNVPVVAEGVESEDQLAFLARESCDEVQGYLIGRPGPIENYAAMVGRTVAPPRAAALAG